MHYHNYDCCANSKKRKKKKAHKQKTRKLTSNVTEDSPSFLMNVVFDFGTDAWIMHVKDWNWFKLSESPTNIILLPLHFSKKYNPLNLLCQFNTQLPNIETHMHVSLNYNICNKTLSPTYSHRYAYYITMCFWSVKCENG